MYTCHIEEMDQPDAKNKLQTPEEKVAENHTVTCHENDIDVFKSLVCDQDVSKQSDRTMESYLIKGAKNVSDLNTLSNPVCPGGSNSEAHQVDKKAVNPSQTVVDSCMSKNALSRSSSLEKITASKHHSLALTPKMSLTPSRQLLTAPRFNSLCSTQPPANLLGKENTTRSKAPNLTPARDLPLPLSAVTSTCAFPQSANVRNISPMDLLIDLTKPKPNLARTAQTRPIKYIVTTQHSDGGLRSFTPRTGVLSNLSTSRATVSPVNVVKTVRTPIPLAPKPLPYTPVTFLDQYHSLTSSYKRLAPKQMTTLEPRGTLHSKLTTTRTVTTAPLIFHSTEVVTHRDPSKAVPIRRTTMASAVCTQATYVAPATRPLVTTKAVQPLSKATLKPSSKQAPSKIVKLYPNPCQDANKPNQTTSKIVQLNTDPAQLAANFLRLRAKAVQASSNSVYPKSTYSNTAPETISTPSQSFCKHATSSVTTPHTPLPRSTPHTPLPRSTPHTPLPRYTPRTPLPSSTPHSSGSGSSTLVSTIPRASHKAMNSDTSPRAVSEARATVAGMKGDSDEMAVLVGSPEQIAKLLSENPGMIELLGSKSTDYLGKLLSSHSKRETCVRQLTETKLDVKQNGCEIIKRPCITSIGLNKSPTKHVIDITQENNRYPNLSEARKPQVTPTSCPSPTLANVSSILNLSGLPSLTTTLAPMLSPSRVQSTETNFPSTSKYSGKTNKIDLSNCRSAVRKLDRSCLNISSDVQKPRQRSGGICKSGQASLKSPSLDTHRTARSAAGHNTSCVQKPVEGSGGLCKPGQTAMKSPTLDAPQMEHTTAGRRMSYVQNPLQGKSNQAVIKSPTLDNKSPTRPKSRPQYIFHNRRFLHASLDTPSLEKKANRVAPLSSPTKLMGHVEGHLNNLRLPTSDSTQGVEYFQKLRASKVQGKQDKILSNGENNSLAKKDIVESRVKRTYTKRKYTKRKGLDKDITQNKRKRADVRDEVTMKRKGDDSYLGSVKKTRINEDDIVLPDFARVKQSEMRTKRLEKVNQELNVMFIITSEEGLEVKARSCEGRHVVFLILTFPIVVFTVIVYISPAN